MSEKIVLCACSGMNPRGEVARVSVYDLTVQDEDLEYCCIVASGGNYQKFINLAQDNTVIAVNGCENKCPETILRTKDASVEYNLNVSKLLKKHGLKAQNTVRINENDEECVKVIKDEIKSLIKTIGD